MLPIFSYTNYSTGKVNRVKADSITQYVQLSAPIDSLWQGKELLLRTLHKQAQSQHTTMTNLEEERGKLFPPVVTKYFLLLYITWIHMTHLLTQLNLVLCWSTFYPSAGTTLFLVIDSAFPFILLQTIQNILLQLIRITLKNYWKVQNICLTFYPHILQQ